MSVQLHYGSELNIGERTANTRAILSGRLREAIEASNDLGIERPKILAEPEIAEIRARVLSDMAALGHPYHNHVHTKNVVQQVQDLARAARLNPAETQLLEIAALFHDYGHAGNTYRQLVPSAEMSHLSNEEYSAIKADEMIGDRLSLAQRIILQGLILATSFGQSNFERISPSIRADAYRPYHPVTKMEKLLAFADVSSGLVDFAAFDANNAALIREDGWSALPDFDAYLNERLGFLNYLQTKLDEIREILDPDSGKRYQERIEIYRRQIATLRENPQTAQSTHMAQAFQEVRGAEKEGRTIG